MKRSARLSLLVLPALAGCVGPPVAPALPPPLAYRMPAAPGPWVYVQTDTAAIDVAAGGQTFAVAASSSATWALELADAPDGLRVTAVLRALDARLDDPFAGVQRADEGGVDGPTIFTLGPRGAGSLVRAPSVEGAARRLFTTAPLVHHLFPRLPGRAVGPGDAWTDTIRYRADEGAGEVGAEVSLTYTVVGDTLVAGLPYLLVRFEGRDRRSTSGEAGGMTYGQDVEGPVAGFFLWDRRRDVLHALEQRSDLGGTMAVSLAAEPLDVRVRATLRVELVGG